MKAPILCGFCLIVSLLSEVQAELVVRVSGYPGSGFTRWSFEGTTEPQAARSLGGLGGRLHLRTGTPDVDLGVFVKPLPVGVAPLKVRSLSSSGTIFGDPTGNPFESGNTLLVGAVSGAIEVVDPLQYDGEPSEVLSVRFEDGDDNGTGGLDYIELSTSGRVLNYGRDNLGPELTWGGSIVLPVDLDAFRLDSVVIADAQFAQPGEIDFGFVVNGPGPNLEDGGFEETEVVVGEPKEVSPGGFQVRISASGAEKIAVFESEDLVQWVWLFNFEAAVGESVLEVPVDRLKFIRAVAF